jgi:hypothetical protein
MAVQNMVNGLVPLMTTLGGAPARLMQYGKPVGDSNPIYMNDVVQRVHSSVVDPAGGNPAPSIRGGNLGTSGTGLWLGSSLNNGAASTLSMHLVCDDPGAIFLIQSDSSSAETVANIAGRNADLNVSGGSNAQLGPIANLQSGMTLKSSTIATTTGLDLRILDLLNSPQNPDNAAYPILEVTIVLHQYAGSTTAV